MDSSIAEHDGDSVDSSMDEAWAPALAQLNDMGLHIRDARKALHAAGGDVARAVEVHFGAGQMQPHADPFPRQSQAKVHASLAVPSGSGSSKKARSRSTLHSFFLPKPGAQ